MKAVIISSQRCGGLFLSGCLSNHPEISCPREEIFKRDTPWQKLCVSHRALLSFVLSQPHYKLSMCRLTYDQAFHNDVIGYIKEHHVKIIHLVRNVLPVVTSTLLAKREIEEGTPRHYFEDSFADNEILDASPEEVVTRIKHLLKQRDKFYALYGKKNLEIWYERLLSENERFLSRVAGNEICDYLGVRRTILFAENRKMHKRPISTYYRDWKAVYKIVKKSFQWIKLDENT